MRTLVTAPSSAIDPATNSPRFGSYRGGLPEVDLTAMTGRGVRERLLRELRHKRWMYVAIASEDLYIAVAVVRLGYAANAFAFVFDKGRNEMVFDRSSVGPPFACRVGDKGGAGCVAGYRLGDVRISIARAAGASAYTVEAHMGALNLHARLESAAAPPSLTAIAPIPGNLVSTTEKRTLLAVTGDVTLGGRRRSLDGALAGYDYTNGLLAHHTAWRWGFLLGRATSGERVGLNLVQGFVGEPECGVWVDGELYPLAEGRFAFDEADPMHEWHVTTEDGSVDLRFLPGGVHAEKKNFGVVASRFIQPVGLYSGTIRVPGRAPLELDRVLGVSEDQDVRW